MAIKIQIFKFLTHLQIKLSIISLDSHNTQNDNTFNNYASYKISDDTKIFHDS